MIYKIALPIVTLCLAFTSCTTDIEINTPALQATVDGELFRPDQKKAVIYPDGRLEIIGTNGFESMSFSTSSTDIGTYKSGNKQTNNVLFQLDKKTFQYKEGISIGQVTITSIEDNLVSGTFTFSNLENNDGTPMSFENGIFYRLPLENFVPETPQEDDTPPAPINPCLQNAELNALVNGVPITTDTHQAKPFGVNNSSIRITAKNATDEIRIVFPIDAPVGEHDLSSSGFYTAAYSYNNDTSSAISGKLIITDHDTDSKCIAGSFEFATRQGDQITQGTFDYGY